jgi:hypothetical protein
METIDKKRDIAAQLCERWENDPGFVDRLKETIEGCLDAANSRWDKSLKDWADEPDFRTRIDAVKLIFAYSAGLPLQRSVAFAVAGETYGKMQEMLESSPAVIEAMKRQIEKVEWKGGKKAPRKVQPVEAEPSELPAE